MGIGSIRFKKALAIQNNIYRTNSIVHSQKKKNGDHRNLVVNVDII